MRSLQTGRRVPGANPLHVLFWWGFIAHLVHVFMTFFYRIRIIGRERIPPRGPVIFVANHQSHFDPPIVGLLTRDRPFASLARKSLFRFAVFGWLIRQLGAIPLDQKRGNPQALREAERALKAGRSVLIFPEGSRTPDGTIREFREGIMLLIRRARVPVQPIAIEGAYDVWPIHQPAPNFHGRVAVMAGEVIAYDELMKDGRDAALERIRRDIEVMRLHLRTNLRRATGGTYPAPGPGDQPYWQRDGDRDDSNRAHADDSQQEVRAASRSA